MKKLLAMLGAAGLVVSTSAVLVSCGSDKDPVDASIVNLTFTLGENNKEQTVELGELKDVKVSVEVKTEEKAEGEAVATATLDEKTNIITFKALAEGKVTYLVKTTPIEQEKPESFEEGEGTTPVEPTLIKTINIEVKPELVAETPNLDKLAKDITTAKAIEQGKKTDEAFATLKAAITAAEAVKDEDKAAEASKTLNTAVKAFNESADKEEATPNLDQLAKDITAAKAIEQGKKTDEAFSTLKAAITAAEAVKDEDKAAEASKTLNTAVNAFNESADKEENEDPGEGEGTEPETEALSFFYQA